MTAQPPQRKYRIERYLAEGGMGAIYVGKKLGVGGFEKEVVLKQLLPEFTERPEFRDLFFREAKISASLDHVNVVRTSDLVASDESLFIVMEYVRGADLRTINWRARLKRRALSPKAVLHVALEILAGLAYAHGRKDKHGQPLGIIHRDVSPSNILCSGQGDVKLSDFGIAKATTFSSVFYRVRGKVGYMSPEQARNQPLDARSDLFSLAVCIFETLTAERLYAGDLHTPAEEIYGPPLPSLAKKRPDLPADLEAIMAKALAVEADERFQEAGSFAEALRDLARRHGLLYSAPLLADELHALLGPDAGTWSHDETLGDTERMPAARTLEGKEATSIKDIEEHLIGSELGGENTVSLRPLAPGETRPADAQDRQDRQDRQDQQDRQDRADRQDREDREDQADPRDQTVRTAQPQRPAERTITPIVLTKGLGKALSEPGGGTAGLGGPPAQTLGQALAQQTQPAPPPAPPAPPAAKPRSTLRRRAIFIAYLLVVGAGIVAGALWTTR
jgi:eukaryotic-like serine/threonine-protein kinase